MWHDERPNNPGGGGGGGYSPQILVGMCRGKVKMGKGSGTGSRSSVKMWGSGTSLSRFELENAGLRNELEPFWAWKCESPERSWSVLSVKMRISGTAANPLRCRTLCVRAEQAVGGDERVEIKKNLKIMVSGTAKSAKQCKMVMLRNGFFGNMWKLYAPERKFRAENGGLSRGTYPICIHYGSTPPPPGPISRMQITDLNVEESGYLIG